MSAEPLQTAMKLSFQNWIAFLSMLWRCLFGGASWEVMPEACIDSLYFSDISLSKMLCFGFNPQRRIRVRACSQAMTILPLVWLFIGSTHVK